MICSVCAKDLPENCKVVWVDGFDKEMGDPCCSMKCAEMLKEYKVKIIENKLEYFKNQPLLEKTNKWLTY